MNYIDCFSGIGGFAYACHLADLTFDHHFYSEIDRYANRIYRQYFPTAIALGNITKIKTQELKDQYGDEWFLTGGFPCQDISTGGRRKGIVGSRSSLWYEFLRVLTDLRPRAAVIENVGELSSHGLDRLLFGLAAVGYDAEWIALSASQFGASHRRKRLWVVAYPNMCGLHSSDSRQKHPQESDMGEEYVSPIATVRDTSWADWQGEIAKRSASDRPILRRVDDGIPGWVDQGKALGNAIVPHCAAWVIRRIMATGLLDKRDT